MAREISVISADLKQRFVDNSTIQTLYGLTPGMSFDDQFSKVSFEGILFYIISVSIWTLENLFDDHKTWIENRASEIVLGNTAWYKKTALNFQYGDSLIFIDDVYKYETINDQNKIVKFASVTDEGNYVLLKLATLDGSGEIIPLTTTQLTAFNTYIKKTKFAGVKVLCISREPDLLKISLHIYIDSLYLDASGKLLTDGTTSPIENTINSFIKNLPFNGKFSPSDLIDALQQTSGVINPVFDNASAKSGSLPYSPIIDYYTPNAGYLKIDPSFPLSSTITYILA